MRPNRLNAEFSEAPPNNKASVPLIDYALFCFKWETLRMLYCFDTDINIKIWPK